jgi:hypothetical protein
MNRFPTRRFPGHGRKHDSAALVLSFGGGLGWYRATGRRVGLAGVALSPAAAAIAQAEGYKPGTIPYAANNPGDLELGDIGYGTISASGGNKITVFPSAAAGAAALENQIGLMTSGTSKAGYNPGMSIAQVGQLYSGGSSAWANNVAAALGVSPDTNFAAAASGAGSQTPQAATPASEPASASTDFGISDLLPGLATSGDSGQDATPLYMAAGLGVLGALALAFSG